MQTDIHKHPGSLRIFFTTEMWERYGFYVVQSLLALYLAFHYHWSDKEVYSLVGSFTALTYLSPILGGWIADHLLGQKTAIIAGALFLFISYLALTLTSTHKELIFALSGIAVGTGLLKPNISSLLGNEYTLDSPKRESGYTIFYMGITTGIILGTTIPYEIHDRFGWPTAFLSAAFGMIIALLIFTYGVKQYQIKDYHPKPFELKKLLHSLALIALLWFISFYTLAQPFLADILFLTVATLALIYLIYTIYNEAKPQARKTTVIALLSFISVIFWAFYFQMFLSLTLFISRVVNPTLLGINFPPPYYVCIQSIGMIVFGFFISFSNRALKKSYLNTGNKFLLSMFFMCLAYLLITYVAESSNNSELLSPWLFIPAYLLISLAELLLSPVGLAAITVLASPRKVSTMMGIFFVTLGIGGFLSGKLASLTAIPANLTQIMEIKAQYAKTFGYLLEILLVSTLVCFIIAFLIKKLISKNVES